MRVAALLVLPLLALAPAAAQEAGWERLLPGIAGSLRACLAERPGAMVVEAWPMEAGRLAARLLMPGGAREDCVVGTSTTSVETRHPVPPQEKRPGEGLRAFMLERRCVDAWRIDSPEGRELGWLAYPGCG